MEYAQVLDQIFRNIEEDKVDLAVMGCLRIARHSRDYLSAATFLRELYPDKHEIGRLIFDDMSHLKEEAQKAVYQISGERWLSTHTLDFPMGTNEEGEDCTVLKVGIGEITSELEQAQLLIDDMKLLPGMDPFDIAAFTDRYRADKTAIRLRIRALNIIRSRVCSKCLNYAVQFEKQLRLQKEQQGLLDAVQNDVNNYFKSRSEDVFAKLQKATQLAGSSDLEDTSLLLTEVRRALKAAADYFYPASQATARSGDGDARSLGDDKYLNRLHEFVRTNLPRSTSRDLLDTELDYLISFLKRLNDMASKGVHANVTLAEARQGLVGLYFFLFNLTQRLTLADTA